MANVNVIVEGVVDESVAVRLILETGHTPGEVYGKRGIGYVQGKIGAFNQSAHAINYLALVDLMDTAFVCAPQVINNWLPHRNAGMLFRVAVREVESWILADRDGVADLLAIRTSKVPHFPELEIDPKQTLVNLARRSRRKSVRDAFLPKPGSSTSTGRLYPSEISRFVQTRWNIAHARANSPSLARCIDKLTALPVWAGSPISRRA